MKIAAVTLTLLAVLCGCDSNQSGDSNTDNPQDQLPIPTASPTS